MPVQDMSDSCTLFLWVSDNSRGDDLVSWTDPQDLSPARFADRIACLTEDELEVEAVVFVTLNAAER